MVLVIENMAGTKGVVGSRFEELAAIIAGVKDKTRVGVCLDTCHLFAAGYDIRTDASYAAVMAEFEAVVGFRFLRGVHLNDSKGDLGCRTDRHEGIGRGYVGARAFELLVNDPRFRGIPLILETPCADDVVAVPPEYVREIKLLNSMVMG